uniref:Large ribosomal subunit protein uL4 C-terminal domain-containing protein n=1 Tax=Myotis myotis TaxID=51298 RepID=A0A7J8AMJ5_MYOMY|nr:hypothetical protein mMyoMyo1_007987 [Myotis myotis]
MSCMDLGIELPPSRVTATPPMHAMLNITLSKILKSPEIQRALRVPCKKIHSRVLKKKPLKILRIMLKLNSYAKTMRRNTVLRQAKNHKLRVDKAKSDEKGVPGKKPVVGKKGQKTVGLKKQKKPLVGKRLQLPRNQQLRRSPKKRNPPQKKEACDVNLNLFIP